MENHAPLLDFALESINQIGRILSWVVDTQNNNSNFISPWVASIALKLFAYAKVRLHIGTDFISPAFSMRLGDGSSTSGS